MRHPPRSALKGVAVAVLAAGLAGCASTPGDPRDPLEPMNRKIFAFNEAVDRAVLKPVATTYRDVVPRPVRTGVSNFFSNIGDAWSAINAFLQFKAEAGLRNTMRVAVNTVLGLGGLLDIATEAGLDPHPEDFGQTLGHWGIGAGPYLVLPFLGPSTLRDTAALPVDLKATAYPFRHDTQTLYGLAGLRVVDLRHRALGVTDMIDDAALDSYLFVRDGFLQRRRNQVYDGNPPDEGGDEDDYYYDEEEDDQAGDDAGAAAPAGAPAAEPKPPASVSND